MIQESVLKASGRAGRLAEWTPTETPTLLGVTLAKLS